MLSPTNLKGSPGNPKISAETFSGSTIIKASNDCSIYTATSTAAESHTGNELKKNQAISEKKHYYYTQGINLT